MKYFISVLFVMVTMMLFGVSYAGSGVYINGYIDVPGLVLSVSSNSYEYRHHHRMHYPPVRHEYRGYREYIPRHHRHYIKHRPRPYRPHIPECYKPGYRCYEEYRYRLERR
jgi:hypothetical protein